MPSFLLPPDALAAAMYGPPLPEWRCAGAHWLRLSFPDRSPERR